MNQTTTARLRHRKIAAATLAALLLAPMLPVRAASFNAADTSVQMFRWKWNDIAKECSNWLGPQGYGAVQVSPPQASANIAGVWYDVYQPVNYTRLASHMGSEAEFQTMINTCHAAKVRVYADVVVNQMAGGSGTATDGSTFNANTLVYPYFSSNDFHAACSIVDADYALSDRTHVTTCRLSDMPDLKTDGSYVQGQVRTYLNKLVGMGIDGVRLDAAKHMAPADIAAILNGTSRSTTSGETLWITQEVIPDGGVVVANYFGNGSVNEFHYVYAMQEMFRKVNGASLSQLRTIMGTPNNWGGTWGFIPSESATVFVNNWDTERDGSSLVASNNVAGVVNDASDSKRYDLANILMLAWPYGTAQIHSGFRFTNKDQAPPTASPFDSAGNALVNQSWDFIHRWSDISNMVGFRAATSGQGVDYFTSGSVDQIAFSRGSKGFVALNNGSTKWTASLQTGLPAGTYCNVVHGLLNAAKTGCTSDSVTIGSSGLAAVSIAANTGATVPAVALYVNQKVGAN